MLNLGSYIAEGEGRNSKEEFNQFLSYAYGSLREVEKQILIAERLNYIDTQKSDIIMELCNEIGKMLNGFKNSLKSVGRE